MRSPLPRATEDAIFVRLFRMWAESREEHRAALPMMHEEACRHGFKDQAAAACASLFELVEGHLGRRLVRKPSGGREMSSDERALIGLVRSAPALVPGRGSRTVPHGLPGAISWAASATCDAMGFAPDSELEALQNQVANRQDCPFQITPTEPSAYTAKAS
ncbi:MAG: hypothetical protein AAF494_07865 [Pseudomonadota bacterium]